MTDEHGKLLTTNPTSEATPAKACRACEYGQCGQHMALAAAAPRLAADVAGIRDALTPWPASGPIPSASDACRAVLCHDGSFRDPVMLRVIAAVELLGKMLAWHEDCAASAERRIEELNDPNGVRAKGLRMASMNHRESAAWLRAALAKLEAGS